MEPWRNNGWNWIKHWFVFFIILRVLRREFAIASVMDFFYLYGCFSLCGELDYRRSDTSVILSYGFYSAVIWSEVSCCSYPERVFVLNLKFTMLLLHRLTIADVLVTYDCLKSNYIFCVYVCFFMLSASVIVSVSCQVLEIDDR